MFSKKSIADSLFGVQLIFALIFGGGQFLHTMQTGEEVPSITWFVLWQVFLFLNLILAYQAHRNQPSRVTIQTLWSYIVWTLMIGLDLFVLLTMTLVEWSARDTLSIIAVSLGVVITLLVAQKKNLGISDPMVKGYLAVFFKGVPQLILAYEIMLWGGQGVALSAIIAGHATIIARLGQLWFSIKEAGWDRNRIGSAISEIANEGSWIIVTIVWLF